MYEKIKRCETQKPHVNDNDRIATCYMNNCNTCKLNSPTEILWINIFCFDIYVCR